MRINHVPAERRRALLILKTLRHCLLAGAADPPGDARRGDPELVTALILETTGVVRPSDRPLAS